jgi:hypothetical protein
MSRLRRAFNAGAPLWNSLLALSFLFCLFNPVAAIGIAFGGMTLKNAYSTPLGWALTAASFMLAMSGFIIVERIAYVERQRRPLEIASILAIGPSVVALIAGMMVPPAIMWPISAMFMITAVSGLRAAKEVPDIGGDSVQAAEISSAQALSPEPSPTPGGSGKRRRRRRRHKRRPRPTASPR